jgi:hypothetical protein
MTGKLDEALKSLLVQSLPALFGGATPPIQVEVSSELFELDPRSAEPAASEPRPDDRTDTLPFDAAHPEGPYLLAQIPDVGPRRVWLTTSLNDRIPLTPAEVKWDRAEARRFTLPLRAGRDVTGVTGVEVLYSVTAVFAKIKYVANLAVELRSSDPARIEQAAALAVAVIALNAPQLVAAAPEKFREADYGAEIAVETFRLLKGIASGANTRRLEFRAEIALKATRALGAQEGRPIQRIRTVSQPLDPLRPVDIRIDLEIPKR